MQRKIPILFLSIMTLLFISCSEDTTGGDDLEMLELQTAPSDELSTMIQETPSDFTWDYYQDNVRLEGPSQTDFDRVELVFSSFQVRNGEVVNRTTTDPVETTAGDISTGISTEELFPGSEWISGSEWVPTTNWAPGSEWTPEDATWSPSEIESVAMSQVELNQDETLVVVYAHLAEESPDREQTIQPFGIIFQEASTGTLEAITTTKGSSDDSGYTLLVDGANETAMDTADTTSVSGLDEGSHQAELTDIPADCSVNGDNPRTVNITAGETTTTTFEVNCQTGLANQIVFHTGRHGSPEIYAMDADGSNQQRLTNNSDLDSSPVISNDGSQVAFVSGRDGGQHLFVMNADGSGAQRVTTATTDPGFHTWSPDDSQLAFADYDNGRDIFKIETDGSGRTQLTSHSAEDAFPTWSPDGDKIAFASDRDGGEFDIYTIDTDGSNIQQITSNIPLHSYSPTVRWSPSGDKLVLTTDSGAIMTIEDDGSNPQPVTDDTNLDRNPAWSPDGSEIVFERDGDIFKKSADGSGSATQLTTDPDSDIEPFWSPVE